MIDQSPTTEQRGLPVGLPTLPLTPPHPETVATPETVAETAPDVVEAEVVEVVEAEVVEATEVGSSGLPTTRPAVASRKARRPAGGARKVTRYTLDLEAEMHRGLRLYAVTHEVEASKVMRALLWLLMAQTELPAGGTLSDLVLDEIFDETEE